MAGLCHMSRALSLRLAPRHTALVPRGGVLVDQPFARGAIEQAGCLEPGVRRGAGSLSLLENGPQVRTLRTIADVRRARLAHVLLCGIDLGHVYTLQKDIKKTTEFAKKKASAEVT